MKFFILFSLFTLLNIPSSAQKLDQSISEIADDIAQKVSKKKRTKLALTDFVNSEGKVDALTDYIREELELKLINSDSNLQIIDRKHIKLLLSEHHLQSEGLIDETTAKSAISFIKVDGWVMAEITSLSDQIKIKVTITDVSTSQIYAASASSLISDISIKNLLNPEIKICTECGGKGQIQLQTICKVCEGKGSYKCNECSGTGNRPGMTVGSYITCEACNGKGQFNCKACSGKGKFFTYQTCTKCNGKVQLPPPGSNSQANQVKMQFCEECSGNGKIKVVTICRSCSGTGEIPFGPASNWEKKACKSCAGKGELISFKTCTVCDGSGKN